MEPSLHYVWAIFYPFVILLIIASCVIILLSNRDVIVDYPLILLLIGRFIFCTCNVTILLVVYFEDVDWSETLCYAYYWIYAAVCMADSLTVSVTLVAILFLLNWRRETLAQAHSPTVAALSVLCIISILVVSLIVILKEEAHPYPYSPTEKLCTFVPKQLHDMNIALGIIFALLLWLLITLAVYGGFITQINVLYLKYMQVQKKQTVIEQKKAHQQNTNNNNTTDSIETSTDNNNTSDDVNVNNNNKVKAVQQDMTPHAAHRADKKENKGDTCMSGEEMYLLLDRRLVLGIMTLASLGFNILPMFVLTTYHLIRDKDYSHSEDIVIGCSLLYGLLLPILSCSISHRYWTTVTVIRGKHTKSVDRLSEKYRTQHKLRRQNGFINRGMVGDEESGPSAPPPTVTVTTEGVLMPPGGRKKSTMSEGGEEYESDTTWDDEDIRSSYRSSPTPSLVVQVSVVETRDGEQSQQEEEDNHVQGEVIAIHRSVSKMSEAEDDDRSRLTSSFRGSDTTRRSAVSRNGLGYVNQRPQNTAQHDTDYENYDSEGSVRPVEYQESDIDDVLTSEPLTDVSIDVTSEDADPSAAALADDEASDITGHIDLPLDSEFRPQVKDESFASIKSSHSPKISRRVMYVNDSAKEAFENKNELPAHPVHRTQSAVDRGEADGKDSSDSYPEDLETHFGKTSFMDDLNNQRDLLDQPILGMRGAAASSKKSDGKPKVSLWKTKVMPLVFKSRRERDSAVTKAWESVMMTQRVLDLLGASTDKQSSVDEDEEGAWSDVASVTGSVRNKAYVSDNPASTAYNTTTATVRSTSSTARDEHSSPRVEQEDVVIRL